MLSNLVLVETIPISWKSLLPLTMIFSSNDEALLNNLVLKALEHIWNSNKKRETKENSKRETFSNQETSMIVKFHFQDTTFNIDLKRVKRASHRGQTQSQYLSFGGDDDGKAEAEATNVSAWLVEL